MRACDVSLRVDSPRREGQAWARPPLGSDCGPGLRARLILSSGLRRGRVAPGTGSLAPIESRTDRGSGRRARLLAILATLALVAFSFVGRAVLSADDGAEMISDTLGFLVQGRFESASIPPATPDPFLPPPPAFRSRYGLVPSLVPLPFLAVAWPFRRALGAAWVDASASLTWAAGAILASLAFLRLARALRSSASSLWVPGFLGGTFLWAYVADSYIEPWAAAGLAFSAAEILSPKDRSAVRAASAAAAGAIFAFWLRPVAWVLAPVLFLAALLRWKACPDGARRSVWLLSWLGLGLAATTTLNWIRNGSPLDFGHGFVGQIPFVHAPLVGLLESTLLPGRGVVLYAPVVFAAFLAVRRLGGAARVLCLVAPILLVLVSARWFVWHGGSAWGPRFLIPVLPLLAAPAVLAPRRLVAVLLAVGALVNFPGVVVAAGAYQSYAERLIPPPDIAWPAPGGDRVSEVAILTPLYGHAWLLANALSPGALPAPWLSRGARETMPPPGPAECLSPWLVRRAIGLPPVSPILPRLIVRSAAGYLMRGYPAQAALFARAALSLEPRSEDASRLLAEAERRKAQ
jgi:hypothetical protein